MSMYINNIYMKEEQGSKGDNNGGNNGGADEHQTYGIPCPK